MNLKELIYQFYQRGITVQADGSELLLCGPTDMLTAKEMALLKQHKVDLLLLLTSQDKKDPEVDISEDEKSYKAPASNLQRNIYFLESLLDGKSFYNVPTAFKLTGKVDVSALYNALSLLCNKLDILRTVYQLENGELSQVIEPYQQQKLPFEYKLVKANQVPDLLKKEANYLFHLGSEWPIRVILIECSGESYLSINMHHIAVDGHSAKLIIEALSEAYSINFPSDAKQSLVIEAVKSPAFSAPQYASYAIWHQEYLNSSACENARKHWQQVLKGSPSCHNFPLEFQRPSVMSVEGDLVCDVLDSALCAELHSAARRNNTSPFLLLQSLFAGFMARLGDEQDLLISSVYANRLPTEFSNTVGMFANTIPFRYGFNENTDLEQVLQSTKKQHLQALKHQQFPFEMMLEGLNIERDSSYNPMVQVQFVLQQEATQSFKLPKLEVQELGNRQLVAKFDFSVHVAIQPEQIKIHWEFNTNLFSKERITGLLSDYMDFCRCNLQHPSAKILTYQFSQNLAEKVASKADFASYQSNSEIIAVHSQTNSENIAVIDGQQRLTYGNLVEQGSKLISGLQNEGLKIGDRVAVYMDKNIDQVVAMYAVMRAGFVYVPLDPSYPVQRLAFICKNSKARTLIYSSGNKPDREVAGSTAMFNFEHLTDVEAQPQLQVIPEQQPAYIIYTSGSTGQPKGVEVPHGSIFYSLQANRKVYDYGQDDIMPTVGSQAFGVSLLETFVPLISGGTVLTLNKSDVTDLKLLIDKTQQVTVMHMVPSLMAQWLDNIAHDRHLYPQLRLLLVGAEPVPPVLLSRLKAWRKDIVVRVLYGMTESSVVSSGYVSDEHQGSSYSIGKPHPNMNFYAMNRLGVPQPQGVPGELYVGGLSLANGYIGLPELTKDKFVQHPILHERLYKTGDRARLTADGHFEFLGRVDNQVSLRGIRIETGEIESLVNKISGVKKCIAHVVKLDNGDSKFVLYYTSEIDKKLQQKLEQEIRTQLSKGIPESMRPSLYMNIESFPHNPNGKVDRNKLPKPEKKGAVDDAKTRFEVELRVTWGELLELEQVSVTDNFFELGGHSLMATKLIALVNEKYSIDMPLRRFFEAATIRECARIVEQEVTKKQVATLAFGEDVELGAGEHDEFVI